MKIMSVDYGDARTGIALCDQKEMLAAPLCVIAERREQELLLSLCNIIKAHRPELIVVGLPKNMDGSIGERAAKCRNFANKLSEMTGIEVDMWDERLTTVSAYRALNEADFHGKKTRKVIDAVAATTILQDYLNYRKNRDI